MMQAEYDIYCALRGPDIENILLKYLTTGVIRYFVGIDAYRFGIVVTSPVEAIDRWVNASDEQKSEVRTLWRETLVHHHSHVVLAFRSLLSLVPTPNSPEDTEWRENVAEYYRWLIWELNPQPTRDAGEQGGQKND